MKKKYLLYCNSTQCWVVVQQDGHGIDFIFTEDIKQASEMSIDIAINVNIELGKNQWVIISAPLYNLTSEQVKDIAVADIIFEQANKLKDFFVTQRAVDYGVNEDKEVGLLLKVNLMVEELDKQFGKDIDELRLANQ